MPNRDLYHNETEQRLAWLTNLLKRVSQRIKLFWVSSRLNVGKIQNLRLPREVFCGEVVDGEMMLNPLGHLVQSRWQLIQRQFSSVSLDDFVVMPNHMHAIVTITDPLVGALAKPCPYKGVSSIVNVPWM